MTDIETFLISDEARDRLRKALDGLPTSAKEALRALDPADIAQEILALRTSDGYGRNEALNVASRAAIALVVMQLGDCLRNPPPNNAWLDDLTAVVRGVLGT